MTINIWWFITRLGWVPFLISLVLTGKWPSPIWWGLALVSLTYYLGGGINKDIVTPIRNEAAQARYEKALLAEKRREENKAYWAESKELGGEIMGKIIFPLMLAILASFLLCNALNVIDFIG